MQEERKRRKEKEDRKKKFEEQIEMWKSGKILELYLHYYLEDDQPNVWLRIKNGIIETSKNIKIERAEAERLWKLIKLFHNGGKFQRDMVLDTTGHKWKINSYKNDILVAGCHRIAYSEMKGGGIQNRISYTKYNEIFIQKRRRPHTGLYES